MAEAGLTRRYHVTGRVQGVGYRQFVAREAISLGLGGWVMNLSDGRVEVLARGSESQHLGLLMALKTGPKFALVESVAAADVSDEVDIGKIFHVR